MHQIRKESYEEDGFVLREEGKTDGEDDYSKLGKVSHVSRRGCEVLWNRGRKDPDDDSEQSGRTARLGPDERDEDDDQESQIREISRFCHRNIKDDTASQEDGCHGIIHMP